MPTTKYLQTMPTVEEIAIARESGQMLSAYLQTRSKAQPIRLVDETGTAYPVRIPVSALRLLAEVLTEIGQGNSVNIIPVHAELTTQEAADLLNVSRPHLVKLLENNELPFHKTGTHRRIRYQDVIAYKEAVDAKRRKALDELTQQAQELGMGYE